MRCFGLLTMLALGPGAACASGEPLNAPVTAGATDAQVRDLVSAELDRLVAEWSPASAVIVVLDPRDGRIVAAQGRLGSRAASELAAERAWVTGSTLKPLTLAAALEAGVIAPDTMIDCAERGYPEGVLKDYAPHGMLSVRDALAVSSNVGTSRVLDALGLAPLVVSFRRVHVFEAPGSLPEVGDARGLAAGMLAAGELAPASPLRLAAAYGALFDEGRYHAPTVDGTGATEVGAIAASAANAVVGLLEHAVASDLGPGRGARIPGHRVAGKTGTAELADGRAYASFVGAVLDVEPLRVVLVGLEAPREGGTGGSAAAPAFARLAAGLIAR